ncbi:hypothetical protein CPB84DRAFT_821562 [Gymnopilus junonius]|uniref:Uncharacterized protein n=1 Tax=Gymnopilus junonius TaxID=109634 RepID=A0A9P5TPC5_GYMJU|nr:hypothetical protein CPB84DRAFT_821562 [Gymnopilus junonius]
MQFRSALVTLALSIISFSSNAAAASCAVCAPTIVFDGLTRTLTLSREEEDNTLQCNYDTPPIEGFSPGCLYLNVDGQLIFTNTAGSLFSLPGACPSTLPLVEKTSC